MNILGVIPARGGSKGIPGKNINPVAGHPLISYSILEANKSSKLTDVIVSTDSREIKSVAEQYGADVPFIRPSELATDEALSVNVMIHAVHEMEKSSGKEYDFVMMLQPTTPLRTAQDIDSSIEKIVSTGCDSVVSMVDVGPNHPMRMYTLDEDRLVPLLKEGANMKPRQELPAVYIRSGDVYIVKRSVLLNDRTLIGRDARAILIPPERAVNVDSKEDLIIAESKLRTKNKTVDLEKYYKEVYSTKNKSDHFIKYRGGRKLSEAHEKAIAWLKENDISISSILDVGCGEADFLDELKELNIPKRAGIDFSEDAIKTASENYPELVLNCRKIENLDEYENAFDVVSSFGVLEHVDSPVQSFKDMLSCVKPGGLMIISCPSFTNTRGVIWMTLQLLFDVPMSLSDKHFLSLYDFQIFENESDCELVHYCSVDVDLGQKDGMIKDMNKRLKNALRDAGMNNQGVGRLLSWLENNKDQIADNQYSGAEGVYIFKKK